jgi:hypothetical protein
MIIFRIPRGAGIRLSIEVLNFYLEEMPLDQTLVTAWSRANYKLYTITCSTTQDFAP